MRPDSRASLYQTGFEGFASVAVLRSHGCGRVPDHAGVYVVYRPRNVHKRFLPDSPAGRFKGRDPSLSLRERNERWTDSAAILYVGKAGGPSLRATLRQRIRAYVRHGNGARASHWGGRAIWQLVDADKLLIAWRIGPENPREDERARIAALTALYGRRPFANRAR